VSKVKIAGVENRGQSRFQNSELHYGADNNRFNNANNQNEKNCGGQQPARSPRVKPREIKTATRIDFLDQQACDEIAGEHEKDVDADKAAAEEWQSGVGDNNEDDCKGAQAFNIRAERNPDL
jgi:hypothetical protein